MIYFYYVPSIFYFYYVTRPSIYTKQFIANIHRHRVEYGFL